MDAGNLTMDGYENAGNGSAALRNNLSGYRNTASGCGALRYNTDGFCNTASGNAALFRNNTGDYNTAAGAYALMNNTNGNYNTALGGRALFASPDGSFNTAVGFDVLESSTNGSHNAACGGSALRYLMSGDANTAVGCESLYQIGRGSNNIALGHKAGFNLLTGNNNILIGSTGVNGDNNAIRIGTPGLQANNTYLAGIYGATTVDGTAVYVNSAGQLATATSSRRFKEHIRPMGDASAVLYALQPVTFRYRSDIDPQGVPQCGLIAEEVDQVDPNLVVRDNQHGIYSVRYEAVNVMLLNEFLKQHRKVEEQAAEIQDLKRRLERLEQRLSQRNGGER
jgi:hypothetical protein